jgi:Zn-dependent peptidase ImmA (M78 family)/transcriptional regulator with XRE-family HTH domain
VIDRIAKIVSGARARESCSLEDLSKRSSVPESALAAFEQGAPALTTGQLDEVARALSLDPTALLNGREVARPVPSIFLRHEPLQDFDNRDETVLDAALEQGRTLAQLRALLREPATALQEGVFERSAPRNDRPDAPAQEGYRLAVAARRWLNDTAGPLSDVAVLLEHRFGIAVVVRSMETARVTAASVRSQDAGGVVLNSRDLQRLGNPLLARVYLSHELCHVLFDQAEKGLQIVIDMATDRKARAAEQRARAFAAEFLLPLQGLVQLLGDPRGVGEASTASDLVARARSHFGTSHEITANHLCNLNFVDMRLRDWLEATATVFVGHPLETKLPADGDPSHLVVDYARRAHLDGILTDGEARAIIGIDRLAPLPWDDVAL